MDWTDIKLTVPARFSDTAEAIATGISGGGIYIPEINEYTPVFIRYLGFQYGKPKYQ